MPQFPEFKFKEYASVYMEDTDAPLPKTLDYNMRYAFFSTIAKGGKSLIQSCKDLHLCRFVCYKTLRSEFAGDAIEQKRLLREARVSAMLQHPNTVPTYELGRDNRGRHYFTMKLVHGYTMREILDYRERYDLSQLIDVIVQIAHALEYAHSHGVVHRDIKPENILVGPFGEVVLLDWGLAKVWNSDGTTVQLGSSDEVIKDADRNMTKQGKVQGTICYMSPEQIKRDPEIDARTDIYSLGSVVYEILAGRTVAEGDTVDKVIAGILDEQPPRPSELVGYRIPPLLEDLTMRCIRKKPDERVQTMTEMIRLLQENWRLE